ncbi:MAG: hypothetical protein ACYDEX_19675 [Mobilitalea sp.]
MVQCIKKIGAVMKAAFVCTILSFILVFCILRLPIEEEQQEFNFQSAMVISVGLGASFRMVQSNRKKV